MSNNQEKLNEQLYNVIANSKDNDEGKLKKVKYLVYLGADVNAMFFGKRMLFWAKETGDEEMVEFLKENGAKEFEIAKEEADRLAEGFWDKNGKIKSAEEVKGLVIKGANLAQCYKGTDIQIWKSFDLEEINKILKILPKGYEIDGNVDLMGCKLKELPDFSKVKVKGNFDCSLNKLTTLKGAPQEVGGNFRCSSNELTNIEEAPQKVGGNFCCYDNQIITLKGGPKEVGGEFCCARNKLTNLEGVPQKVGGNFDCYSNQLVSLEGGPNKVGGNFYCSSNQLTTLAGAPSKVGGIFDCSSNQLTTLEGAPSEGGGNFNCMCNKLSSLRGKPIKIKGEFCIEEEVLVGIEKGKIAGVFCGIFKNIFKDY